MFRLKHHILFSVGSAWFLGALLVSGQERPVCTASAPFASFSIKHAKGEPELTLDPRAKMWKSAAVQTMVKDCSRQIDYTDLNSQIRSFWTDQYLYFLFRCPYRELNLFLPPDNSGPRRGLWDRDVVEMFLGDDWQNIRRYREFEDRADRRLDRSCD